MIRSRRAVLYRMVLPNHTCPYGLRAKELLDEAGYEVDDRILGPRAEVDAFQGENDVLTTPQIFIDGARIGGSEELELYLIKEQSAA